MSFDALLIHTIYKQYVYSSQNTFGEWAYSYSSQTGSGITCRMAPWTIYYDTDRGEKIRLSGKYEDIRYKCFMDVDEDVEIGDRIVYGSETYRVKEVIIDSSGHHKSALLMEL